MFLYLHVLRQLIEPRAAIKNMGCFLNGVIVAIPVVGHVAWPRHKYCQVSLTSTQMWWCGRCYVRSSISVHIPRRVLVLLRMWARTSWVFKIRHWFFFCNIGEIFSSFGAKRSSFFHWPSLCRQLLCWNFYPQVLRLTCVIRYQYAGSAELLFTSPLTTWEQSLW